MSVERVTDQPGGYPWTPTPADLCLVCSENLVTGDTVVLWRGGAGHVYWHADCAATWVIPFVRDVWEARRATRRST